jgi:predicted metal-binding membrane protein
MFAARIRAMSGPHWLGLYAGMIGAWALLYAMALPADLRDAGAVYGADFLHSLCIVTPDAAGFAGLVAMWAIMSAAMMAPTALPAFATYDDLAAQTGGGFGALVAGYLAVWLGFSLLAAAAQLALYQGGYLTVFGDSQSWQLSAALLALAGAYQFTTIKEACLSKCRAPFAFFFQYWAEGPWRNGLRLGAVCLGCCWALMALAFVGGVMNLGFMALATVVMALEKLPALGGGVSRPLGLLLLASAAGVTATGIWTAM